jgi:hypothetical protein
MQVKRLNSLLTLQYEKFAKLLNNLSKQSKITKRQKGYRSVNLLGDKELDIK